MPTIDSKTMSVRVSNKLAGQVAELAAERGITVNALFVSLAQEAVDAPKSIAAVPDDPEEFTGDNARLYGVALTLVDDLVEEGYPESEIENALRSIRRDML